MHKKLSKKVLIAVLSAAMVFSTPVAMINYNQITTYAQENESVVESAVIEKENTVKIKITLKDKAEFAKKKDGGGSYTADDLKDAITIDVNKESSHENEQNTIGKEDIQSVTFDSDKTITITVNNENKFISSDDIQVNFKEGYLVKNADNENEKTPITFKKNVTNNLEPAKEANKIKNGSIDKEKITLTLVDGIKIKYHLYGGDDNENGEKLVDSFTLSGLLDDTIKPTEAKVKEENNQITLTLSKAPTKPQIAPNGLKVKYTYDADNIIYIYENDKLTEDKCLDTQDNIAINTDNAVKADYPQIASVVADGSLDIKTTKITLTFKEAPASELVKGTNIKLEGEGITFGNVSKKDDNKTYEIVVSKVIKVGAKAKISLIANDNYNKGEAKEVIVHKEYTLDEKTLVKALMKLEKTIADAKALLNSTLEGDNADAIEEGKKFASKKARADLDKVIKEAEKSDKDEKDNLETSDVELKKAVETFKKEIKTGTKKPVQPQNPSNPSSSSGSSIIPPSSPSGSASGGSTGTAKNDTNIKDTKKEDKKAENTEKEEAVVSKDEAAEDAKLKASTKVSGDKAQVKVSDDKLKKAISDADGKLTINSDTKKAKNVEVSLSKKNLSTIAKSDITKVELKSNLGTVTLSKKTLGQIANTAKADVKIALVKGSKGYELKISAKGNEIKTSDKITVNVKATKGQNVYILDKNGREKAVKSSYDKKTKTLKIKIKANTKFIVK